MWNERSQLYDPLACTLLIIVTLLTYWVSARLSWPPPAECFEQAGKCGMSIRCWKLRKLLYVCINFDRKKSISFCHLWVWKAPTVHISVIGCLVYAICFKQDLFTRQYAENVLKFDINWESACKNWRLYILFQWRSGDILRMLNFYITQCMITLTYKSSTRFTGFQVHARGYCIYMCARLILRPAPSFVLWFALTILFSFYVLSTQTEEQKWDTPGSKARLKLE